MGNVLPVCQITARELQLIRAFRKAPRDLKQGVERFIQAPEIRTEPHNKAATVTSIFKRA